MRYRPIGKTSIKVSEIGFGCWTMGGPNWSLANGQPVGWADVKFEEVLEGVKVGLDAGVNHWDNADVYGNGKAERMLADCFQKLGVKRDAQVIATKVGHFKGTSPHAFEPANITHQCEQSLRNLRTDYIDIYYFHHGTYLGPNYATGLTGEMHDYLHEAAATMHGLVKAGKVRAVGQSAYTIEDFERAIPVLRPDVLQNKANLRYDGFIRPDSALPALMAEHGCTFVAFGPLDQGILLDKFDPANPPRFEEGDYRQSRKDFNADTLRRVREKIGRIKVRFGVSAASGTAASTAALSSIASRWVLAHGHVCSAIPGFRNAAQARCNVLAGSDAALSSADVEFCRALFGNP